MSASTTESPAIALDYERLVVPAHRRRSLFFLGLAAAGVGFALTLQVALNSNFTGEEMKLNPTRQGLLEAIRESCGILSLVVLALLAGLAEPIIAAIMLTLVGVGLSAYAVVPDFAWLVTASLVWSMGLHVWMPLPSSMTLALAEPGGSGRRLGQIGAAGAVGSTIGLLAALSLMRAGVQIRGLWFVSGAAAFLSAGAMLAIPRQIRTPRQRLVVRRKYWLYYLLCFLEGWRKQIFLAFAGYYLVRHYHVPVQRMLTFWLVINACGWFVPQLVGRLIDRVGERPILMMYYGIVAIVFCGYIFVQDAMVLSTLFVMDGVFFAFAMGLTTYVGRLCPPEDRTPTLSMGVAMNHIAAVSMPLIGGLVWSAFGHKWTFAIGAVAALASIPVAMLVPSRVREAKAAIGRAVA